MSPRKIRKSLFRDVGRCALEGPGIEVVEVPGRGIVPGARLKVLEANRPPRTVAVRVSLDQQIGFTRHPDGEWVTLPRVDQVVIVFPAADGSDMAEVLSFNPEVLIAASEIALEIEKASKPSFSYKAPVFVTIDDATDDALVPPSGLRAQAEWIKLIPMDSVRKPKNNNRESIKQFLKRARGEAAAILELDVSQVYLRLEISGRPEADSDGG